MNLIVKETDRYHLHTGLA